MKEQIIEEYEKFNNILKGADNQLCALMLTDIAVTLMKTKKDADNKLIKDYSTFDDMIKNVKELLDSMESIPESINLIQSTQENLDSIKRITNECMYSMRTLSWIKDDLLKAEEEKDA